LKEHRQHGYFKTHLSYWYFVSCLDLQMLNCSSSPNRVDVNSYSFCYVC